MSKIKDEEALIAIVEAMTKSGSGSESTKHWAKDALWYDIPPFASRGIQPAIHKLDITFSNFKSCKIEVLHVDTFISNDMGVVCTIQKAEIILINNVSKTLLFRETDCFKKNSNNEWWLIHQHTSVPNGANWDGEIITEE
jgi:ketosteroid isomerase-like protein